jgi:branched-chain amino acid transport system substrate-binding protein
MSGDNNEWTEQTRTIGGGADENTGAGERATGGDRESRLVDRRRYLQAVGAAGAAGLAGCAGVGGTGSSGGGTITYGVLSPISGAFKGLGPGQRQGAKLAVQRINENDDIDVEVEANYYDTGTNTETAIGEAEKAVQQDGADYLMGAISSSVALALNEFAAENEVIYNPGGAAVPITGKACNEYVFRVETNAAQVAEAVSAWTVNNLGTNVWFHIADYAYGTSVLSRTKERMKNANDDFTVVNESKSQLGASNYDSYVSQIANSDADVVVIGMTGGDLINFVKQAAAKGLKEEVALVSPTMTFSVVRGALGADAYGTYGGVRYIPKLDTGDNQDFVSAYQEEYDAEPDNFARVGFESLRMTARGAAAADDTSPSTVKDQLAGMDMPTIFGENEFRECDHQALNPTWMGEIVEPDSGDVGGVETKKKIAGPDAAIPCGEKGCDL